MVAKPFLKDRIYAWVNEWISIVFTNIAIAPLHEIQSLIQEGSYYLHSQANSKVP